MCAALEGVPAARLGEGHRRARAGARERDRFRAAAPRVSRVRGSRREARRPEGRLDEPDGRAAVVRARRLRHGPAVRDLDQAAVTTSTTVSLLRWLRRQLREPTADRERLEAAIAN